MKIIAVYNLKGGVGKTSTAVNLAWLYANAGQRVLLWDLDPQGGATWLLGVDSELQSSAKRLLSGKTALSEEIVGTAHPNLRMLPADYGLRHSDLRLDEQGSKHLKTMLKALAEDYDRVILDCPPSLSRLAEQIFVAVHRVVVPLIPTHLSLRSWTQLEDFFDKSGIDRKRLLPLFSMVDRRRGLHREWLYTPPERLRRRLKTFIPYSTVVEKMGEQRAPVEVFAPNDAVARAYRQLLKELEQRL